ncbi:MAG: DUF5615 family PIN-like protein [Chloroflexi bacterium]|nr:DUF5615 family PIN-like protein [Chloroflexota bacterium]
MRFLADMGISPGTVTYLQDSGHDATHLNDQNLGRLPDSEILDKARSEERILLTHDLDFGELIAASAAHLPSVIIFRLRNMRPDSLNRYMALILEEHEDLLESGFIMSVTEGQIRSRTLPLEPGIR